MSLNTLDKKLSCEISERTLQDLINIDTGLFAPLNGFMNSRDYESVVLDSRLREGMVWTIPITLDVLEETYRQATSHSKLYLNFQNKEVGYIEIEDGFEVNFPRDLISIFKTEDRKHPGVNMELERSPYRIGGRAVLTQTELTDSALRPDQVRKEFAARGWKTVAGFQTRNPIHRAHEHHQRVVLDFCDGLFINPLVGWKKKGDFSEQAVTNGYRAMLDEYYPSERVYLNVLRTPMRYAGPREAVFHAILRKNLGCTHFIIGRDHAGVGDYYGTYEAHEFAGRFRDEIDIELLLFREPYFCVKCNHIVTDNHCSHGDSERVPISGTIIREMLSKGNHPDPRFMRDEVAEAIIKLGDDMFIH